MANEILKNIAGDILEVNTKIEEAQDLIGAMKEAGEDVSVMEVDLRKLIIRKNRWETMLRARGL